MWPKQRPLLKRPLNPNSALIISQAVSLFSALLSVAYPIWLVIWNASIISRISPAILYPKCLLLISGTPIIILDGWLEGFYEAWNTAADTVDHIRDYLALFLTYGETQSLIPDLAGFASLAAALTMSANSQPISALTFLERGRGLIKVTLMQKRIDLPRNLLYGEYFSALRDKPEAGRGLIFCSATQATVRDRVDFIRTAQEYDEMLTDV